MRAAVAQAMVTRSEPSWLVQSVQLTTAPFPPAALKEFSKTTAAGLCCKMYSAGSAWIAAEQCQPHL